MQQHYAKPMRKYTLTAYSWIVYYLVKVLPIMQVPSFSLLYVASNIVLFISQWRILDSLSNQRSFHSAYCYVSTTPLIVACCKLRVRPVQHLYGNALCHLYGLYLPYLIYSLIAVQCCTFFTLHQASPPRFVETLRVVSPLSCLLFLMIVTTTRHVNVTCCSSPHSSLLLLIMITKGVAQVCVPDFPPPLSHTRVFPHCL